MRISKSFFGLISRPLAVFLLLGCFAFAAQAEEKKPIVMMVGEEGPDGCELLGQVRGSSKEGETQDPAVPYLERLMKARNHLRDEALKLGGNTVHIIRSNNTGKYEIPGGDKEVIHIGNVYHCH